MKRRIEIDPLVNEAVEKQMQKCKRVLENPEHRFYNEAKKFLKELEGLEMILNFIRNSPNDPYVCMSQDDQSANHFCVEYVPSNVELKKIINDKKKKYTVLSFEEDGMMSDKFQDIDSKRYVNIFEVISHHPAPSEFIIGELCKRVDNEGSKTGTELMEMFETLKTEMGYGTWATYYVTIRKNF